MSEVTTRELRNHGGDVVKRVLGGESLVVTRSGDPVAEVRPVRGPAVTVHVLLERWGHLPQVDPAGLRADIDAVAVSQQLPIYTINPKDFEHISDLDVVAISHPDTAD